MSVASGYVSRCLIASWMGCSDKSRVRHFDGEAEACVVPAGVCLVGRNQHLQAGPLAPRSTASDPLAPAPMRPTLCNLARLQANANTTPLTLVVNLEQRHVLSKALIPARRLRARIVDTTTAHRCGFNIADSQPQHPCRWCPPHPRPYRRRAGRSSWFSFCRRRGRRNNRIFASRTVAFTGGFPFPLSPSLSKGTGPITSTRRSSLIVKHWNFSHPATPCNLCL